jgi:hypothetical protein
MIGNFQTSKSFNVREREYRCLCSCYVINTYASLMYKLKKIGKVFTSKLFGPGPSSYKQTIYRAAVSQRLGNTGLEQWFPSFSHFHTPRQHISINFTLQISKQIVINLLLLLLLLLLLFPLALQPSAGYGLLVSRGFLITHNDAPQSVGFLCTSNQLVAETST